MMGLGSVYYVVTFQFTHHHGYGSFAEKFWSCGRVIIYGGLNPINDWNFHQNDRVELIL